MTSCLCEYEALVNAYKCEITEKSHFLFVNGYANHCIVFKFHGKNIYHEI